MSKTFYIYTDGGCYRNGGNDPRAYGSYAMYDVTKALENYAYLDAEYVAQCTPQDSCYRFDVTSEYRSTNNLAEAVSLLTTVMYIKQRKLCNKGCVVINMDSDLVLKQVQGIYRTRNSALRKIYEEIRKLLKGMGNPEKSGVLNFNKISGKWMKQILGH